MILFVSTLGLISVTYYFAIERVNTRSQTLKIATAKQNFLSLDENILSTVWQPGSARTYEIADSGGKLYVQPSNSSLEISVADTSSEGSAVYNPSGYSLGGSTGYVSGSVIDLGSNNVVYMNFRSYAGTSTNNFYPSNYVLLGSTREISGSLGDLQADDGVYMTSRSYVSVSSSTSKTDAFIAYRSNTQLGLNYVKNRFWDGDTEAWGNEIEMDTTDSPVRFVRVAVCPISTRALEKIVVTLSDDGYLDAYVFDGTAWTATNNIAFPGPTANAYKCFDVAYEKTSGRAVLVYSTGATTNEIGYKIWTFGTGWGSEQLLNLAYTTGIVRWVSLASCPATRSGTADDNEIALIYLDANTDVHGYIWTGSAWSLMGAAAVWDATAAIATEECIAVEYEQTTGEAMFIWADSVSTDFYYKTWDGTTLSANTLLDITAAGAVGNWVTLKADPASDDLLFVVVDGASDLNTAYWSGSTWAVHTEHDASVDSNAQRCADFAWEPSGGKGLLVWGTTAAQIAYKTFTAPNTWGTQTNTAMGSTVHPWVQLRTNTRYNSGDTMILGAILEGGAALLIGAVKWDGTTFTVIDTNTISYDTTVSTYECFEFEFQQFGDPTEFTSEVEFTGTSNTESWTQLTWTIDSRSTTTNTNATFQLYNYQTGQYPTSGDGFMDGTIGTSDVTTSQSITANPTYFRDGSGNWTMKLKIVKATAQQFDWSYDLARFSSTHITQYTCEVEFSGTSDVQRWAQLDWTADLSFTTPGVTTTLQLYNYATSQYPTSGNGYITDTIGQTDVTKTQTITTAPINFRNSIGNWAVKIIGTKATGTQFDLNVDWIEFKTTISTTINMAVFNGAIGQITYELPSAESADTGLFLKGDSRTITNQSGSLITQLSIRSGAEHPELLLRYRPTVSYATGGIENNRAVNNIRIYIVNLNASETIALYGKVPLKISCESTQITTTTYTFSYSPEILLVTSVLDGASGQVSVPISSTAYGAVINIEIVQCNIHVERCLR